MLLSCSLLLLGATAQASTPNTSVLQAAVQPLIERMAAKYQCAVGVAMHSSNASLQWAAGSYENSSASAKTSELFVWGSITKVSTGAAVMQLVGQGHIGLHDKISPLIDPILSHLTSAGDYNFSSLGDLFGPEVVNVTVHHLLNMKSGIPDYDTANPTPGIMHDSFRLAVYEHNNREYGPLDLLALPNVHISRLKFPPGSQHSYSSINFVLLGLLLAQHYGGKTSDWQDYDQGSFMKLNDTDVATSTKYKYKYNVTWAVHGSPANHTRVRGYDRTDYNGQVATRAGEVNVWAVDGVFSGWTASDFVASTATTAAFAYDVYGPPVDILSPEMTALMVPTDDYYGLATHNLTQKTGQKGAYGTAYGHKGATYGYQSLVAYMPGLDFSLAVATNLELDLQEQPSDIFCSVYNRIRNLMLGTPLEVCMFVGNSYDSSNCNCSVPHAS